MRYVQRIGAVLLCLVVGLTVSRAQDWPQWRGESRDAKATGFKAPKSWPKELTRSWKITVGEGVATPALVADKLYVFSRQQGQEILRCLDAASGKEIWLDKYETAGATGPAASFSGPRSSPAVADGKVVTLGVRGILTCYDAANGKKLWRKDDFKGALPRFAASSSPLIVDKLCIAQLGSDRDGAIVAYDLASGEQKWKCSGEKTAYGSPATLKQAGATEIVAETQASIVGVSANDGKKLWSTPFAIKGRGYNAASPMIDGQTVIYSGGNRGTKAMKIEKDGDAMTAKSLWNNPDVSVEFNTPVVNNQLIFGISSSDKLFCLHAQDGKTAWTTPLQKPRRSGYGSVVDAGSVLFALNPTAELIVFEPNEKEFKKLANYKVADSETYAYPVVSGNRIYVKDHDSLILWTLD